MAAQLLETNSRLAGRRAELTASLASVISRDQILALQGRELRAELRAFEKSELGRALQGYLAETGSQAVLASWPPGARENLKLVFSSEGIECFSCRDRDPGGYFWGAFFDRQEKVTMTSRLMQAALSGGVTPQGVRQSLFKKVESLLQDSLIEDRRGLKPAGDERAFLIRELTRREAAERAGRIQAYADLFERLEAEPLTRLVMQALAEQGRSLYIDTRLGGAGGHGIFGECYLNLTKNGFRLFNDDAWIWKRLQPTAGNIGSIVHDPGRLQEADIRGAIESYAREYAARGR